MTKYYSILPEYYDDWAATLDEHIVTEKDLKSTVRGWDKPLEYVRDMVKEFSPSDYIGEEYDDPTGRYEVIGWETLDDGTPVFTIKCTQEGNVHYGNEYQVTLEEVEYYTTHNWVYE